MKYRPLNTQYSFTLNIEKLYFVYRRSRLKKPMSKFILWGFACFLTFSLSIQADIIAAWDVNGIDVAGGTGIDEGVAPFRFTAPTQDTNISDAKLSLGSGVNPSTSASQYGFKISSAQTTLAGAISNDHYFEFNIEITSGFQLDLDNITMNGRSSSTGADDVALMSSIDGYVAGSEIASLTGISGTTGGFDTDASGFGAPIDLSAAQYQGLTGTISFRLYGFNTSSGSGITNLRNLSGDDLVVNGTTSVVPEPASLGLFLLGALLLRVFNRSRY